MFFLLDKSYYAINQPRTPVTLRQRLSSAAAAFRAPTNNSMSVPLSRQFLRTGNREPMVQDWSQIIANPQDLYTGYPYAAIRNRSNRVAQLATDNLKTDAEASIMKQAKASKEDVVHPYLEIINSSPTFSNYQFWYEISTYLDLVGVYYLLAVRAFNGSRYGAIQEFKLLNPNEVTRVYNGDSLEFGGYLEVRKGRPREIPKEMIIEMRDLNPFDKDEPYAMMDAAKDNQFIMKQSGDFTRSAIKNNISAPGILTTDVMLEPQLFTNFQERVKNNTKGEPLFGNGPGAIKWDPMQIDMDKAALDKITQINVEGLLAVTGTSKTTLGIEVSGVTRDTSKVQTELFVTGQIMPRLRAITDALDQDYKNNYKAEYEKNGYTLYLDSPLGADHESELADIDVRTKSYDLYNTLRNKGYSVEVAAKYAAGEMTLEEIGEPTEEPVSPILPVGSPPAPEPPDTPDEDENASQGFSTLPIVYNQIDDTSVRVLDTQTSALKNAVINIEEQLVVAVLNKVTKNAVAESDIVTKTDRKEAERDLEMSLAVFYGIIIPLYGKSIINRRLAEFKRFGNFTFNSAIKKYIAAIAKKTAVSHVDTILEDLLGAVRKAALDGASQQELVSTIRKEYTETISKTRATAIARTETNRAFTRAQFEADKQFLAQNDLTAKAFKKWVTRSDNPCPFCLAQAARPPIPFDTAFAELGDVLSAVEEKEDGSTMVRKLQVNYETLECGNAHPNCACIYQLVIEGME